MRKQASKEWHAAYREKNRELRRKWNRDWIAANRERYNQSKKAYRSKIKIQALTLYGNGIAACVKCGFDDPDCLVLDHVNDDGALHRSELKVSSRGNGSGTRMYEEATSASQGAK